MAQAKQDMGTGSIKKLMLQLMIPPWWRRW